MKRNSIFFLFLLFCSYACKDKEKEPTEIGNNVDAARNFIRSALDGKFDAAKNFMLPDTTNLNYLDVAQRSYDRSGQQVKDGYRTSAIRIHRVEPINDSVSFIIYSNSYKNDHDTLKVLKMNQQWLVDLKYLYEHDSDTLFHK